MAFSVSQTSNNVQAKQSGPKVANPTLREECKVQPNNLKTQVKTVYQKTTSAFTEYPAKGLTGHKRSNFYEFLAMGTVPYLVGSAMLMAVFNGVSHLFSNDTAKFAKSFGRKAALGVIFYPIFKSLSKRLISTPVKMATGIDTEMIYQRHLFNAEDNPNEPRVDEYEQHKVMESHDFPRYDMLYGENLSELPKYKKNCEKLPHNYLYDKIAKKNGLGENLPSSDTDVKPIIKDVIARSSTAKSLSSFMWAAVGVTLAFQPSWNHFFRSTEKASWKRANIPADSKFFEKAIAKTGNTLKNLGRIAGSFGRSFVDSAKELYKGPEKTKGLTKHAGKGVVLLAAATTVLGVLNTIYGARTAVGQNKNVFDNKRKITVQ